MLAIYFFNACSLIPPVSLKFETKHGNFYSSYISSNPQIHNVLSFTHSNWIFFGIAIYLSNTYSLSFYCLIPSSRCWRHCNEEDRQVLCSDEVRILMSLKKIYKILINKQKHTVMIGVLQSVKIVQCDSK